MQHANNPWLPLAGRLLLAAIFIISGLGKIFNFGAMSGVVESAGIPLPAAALVIAIILELGGGVLLAVGWKTAWAVMGLVAFTVVATAFFHLDLADQLQQVQFLKNLAIVGGLLYVLAHGAGRLSIEEYRG